MPREPSTRLPVITLRIIELAVALTAQMASSGKRQHSCWGPPG